MAWTPTASVLVLYYGWYTGLVTEPDMFADLSSWLPGRCAFADGVVYMTKISLARPGSRARVGGRNAD